MQRINLSGSTKYPSEEMQEERARSLSKIEFHRVASPGKADVWLRARGTGALPAPPEASPLGLRKT